MVGGVGWMLRTLPATFYAVTPPDGIMSSEPLTSQDARTLWRERLVRRPCARARGEAGSCWFWTASGRSGPAQPLEMIGAEQGASASVVPMSTGVEASTAVRESAFSFARSESYPSVQAVSSRQMFPGKCQAVALFIIGNGNPLDIPVDPTRRPEEETVSWFREFRLAL
jgi:hypothetical protein